jgi:hypothetical protein
MTLTFYVAFWPEADELDDRSAAISGTPDVLANIAARAALDADGAAQIASSNCEAYVLTPRRVGDRLWNI